MAQTGRILSKGAPTARGYVDMDALTKREKEVVVELLEGGRVASIAELFGLSPRTVSNHVKSVLFKLGAHSQSELIELARAQPDRLGLGETMSARFRMAQKDLEGRCQAAVERLVARVEEAYSGPPSLAQLRRAARAALPLDAERRTDWRDWLELRARADADANGPSSIQRLIDGWRESNDREVLRLQKAGVARGDLDAGDVLRSLGALALGAGTRLLGNVSEESIERELRMIDGFIDALAMPRAHVDD